MKARGYNRVDIKEELLQLIQNNNNNKAMKKLCLHSKSVNVFVLKTSFLKFKERVRSNIKPIQNQNIVSNGAIFTAQKHERRQGRQNPE